MNQWAYYNPVKIQFSNDYIQSIAEYLRTFDKTPKTLFFCYKWFETSEQFRHLFNTLKNTLVYSDIEENPSLTSCQDAIETVKNSSPELIIAIGGGSVIDTAKVVRASLYKNEYDVNKVFKKTPVREKIPALLALPTTHGTGSEVTMWATVWDKEKKIKKSLSEIENYPTLAIYDVALVKDLPVKISISTTLDALSHSFEEIWNKNRNPFSTQYAINAIKLIYENIDGISDSTSFETRYNLLMASSYAGLAFSNTKTAAAHSISYPLTLNYDMPHGIACSITLPYLFVHNQNFIVNEINYLLKTLNIDNIDIIWTKIFSFREKRIKTRLNEYNVLPEDLPAVALMCFQKDRIRNNIKELSKDDVLKILQNIY